MSNREFAGEVVRILFVAFSWYIAVVLCLVGFLELTRWDPVAAAACGLVGISILIGKEVVNRRCGEGEIDV